MTNLERKRRHLSDDAICPRCGVVDESVLHVIRDCQLVDVAWDPGPPDWVVLNTDGSVMLTTGNAAAGGLLRTNLGRCIGAFSTNLGRCSITRAELRGIIGGLNLAWDAGARRVMVQVDSRAAVNLISKAGNPCHQHAGEVTLIHQLLNREWEVMISHIYREGNQAADYLADIGHGLPTGTHSINVMDSTLCYFLRRDCMGISEPRLITD
ncbi:Putative ribonuclease H protein At1g65750 [Linum perenne]